MKAELIQDRDRKGTTVYDGLLQRIRRSIDTGALKPGALIGSEHELAREAGISRVSVRRAIDRLLREGLVERRPGKGLFVRPRDRSTREVQVVVPDMAFDQCVRIARGAQALGMERGVRIQIYDAHSKLDWDISVLRELPRSGMDGAIIASWHHHQFAESLYELKRQRFPFVLVDERMRDIEVPSVLSDNYGGGQLVGKALIAEGHRRIAFIGNFVSADTTRARLEGLRDALNDAGIPFDRTLAMNLDVPLDGDWPAAISAATREVLDRSDPATAIFYSDDQTAAHGYVALRAMGRRVPEDVSVVGFDDNPLCQWLDPALSTVRQASDEMGRVAMEMLMGMLGDPRERAAAAAGEASRVEHRILPTQWVPRRSIARPATR